MKKIKPEITFDEFSALDVRVGAVTSVEPVPETDKLLKLIVDFGFEKRQIVSGIADRISPEEVLDRQFPFVLNLAPRVIRGVESQGMILAASGNDSFGLLTPHQPVEDGATIG